MNTLSMPIAPEADFLCVPTSLWQQMQRESEERASLSDGLSLTLLALGHDLRQDLHLLQAAVQSTQPAEARAKANKYRELIARLAKKCEQAAVTAAIMRSHGKRAAKRLVDIQPLLLDAYQQWKPEAERKGLLFSFHSPNVEVMTNPFWMGVILSNLIGNAVQHTISGRVMVELSEADNHWLVTVVDSGPGLIVRPAKSHYDAAFVRPRKSGSGLGFGLQLVKHAAALLGNALTISSNATGSVVRLHIPRGTPTVSLLPHPPGRD